MGSKEGTNSRVGTAAHAYLEHRLEGATGADADSKSVKRVKAMTTTEIETMRERNLQSEAYVARTQVFRDRAHVRHEGFEVKLAITQDGTACAYEDPDALLIGSVDHLLEQSDDTALVIDHKSGRVHPLSHYAAQLRTYEVLTVQNRLHLRKTTAGIHHIQNGDLVWQPATSKSHVQHVLLPWLVKRIELAAAGLAGYPAKTSKLCAHCDYHAQCEEGLAFIPLRVDKLTKPRAKKNPTAREKRASRDPFVQEEADAVFDASFDDRIIL